MTYRSKLVIVALSIAAACGLFAADEGRAQSTCDSGCLRGFIDGYLDALQARDPSRLTTADDVKYTENGRVLELGQGIWHTAGMPVRYRDYVLDPDSGNAAVLTAVSEYEGIAQLAVRLRIEGRLISEIETLVVRIGDQAWFKAEQLERFSDIYAATVPESERATRGQLIAAADAYFTAIQTEGTPEFVQAPFGESVNRYENGLQTTNVTENPIFERHRLSPDVQLERAFYKGNKVMNRRFPVVDVEHGSVLAIATFRRDGPDTPTLLLAELFKVTDGKIREIRAVMLNLPNGAGTGWTVRR